jgi:hypothetical protein
VDCTSKPGPWRHLLPAPDTSTTRMRCPPRPDQREVTTTGGTLADGLYRVTTRYLCAGFVVEHGKITMCAPILRKRLAYWRTIAVPVESMLWSTPP